MLTETNTKVVAEEKSNRQYRLWTIWKLRPMKIIPVYNEDSFNSTIMSLQLLYEGTLALIDQSDEETALWKLGLWVKYLTCIS